jgi:hypothetical protein
MVYTIIERRFEGFSKSKEQVKKALTDAHMERRLAVAAQRDAQMPGLHVAAIMMDAAKTSFGGLLAHASTVITHTSNSLATTRITDDRMPGSYKWWVPLSLHHRPLAPLAPWAWASDVGPGHDGPAALRTSRP